MWFNSIFFIPPAKHTISGEDWFSNGKEFTFSGEDRKANNR
jgi:hypothetical protein